MNGDLTTYTTQRVHIRGIRVMETRNVRGRDRARYLGFKQEELYEEPGAQLQ